MKRLAFVSPLPPAATGIADYAVEVATSLVGRYALDLFHAGDTVERVPAGCQAYPAGDFLARHRERPYDLALYQMGNGPAHAFLYDLLARVPGLLVLHDLVLHHSRARTFLDSEAARAYAREPWSAERREAARAVLERYHAEVEYAYPGRGDRLAAAHLETSGRLLPYAYPLFRIPVEASRLTAVHNDFMADAVRAEVPEAHVTTVPMPASPTPIDPGMFAELRTRHALGSGDLVVGVFGLLTPEKRVETAARAVARVAGPLPGVKLLLVGDTPDRQGLEGLLASLGVRERTIIAGRVPWDELAVYVSLPDMVVHLRYPTARETSAALLRVLAQGRPAVIADLAHQADIPEDAVLRIAATDEEGGVTRAILRLAASPALRERLSRNARAWIEREHSPAHTRDAYAAAIEEAVAAPAPPARAWPAHWKHGDTVPL